MDRDVIEAGEGANVPGPYGVALESWRWPCLDEPWALAQESSDDGDMEAVADETLSSICAVWFWHGGSVALREAHHLLPLFRCGTSAVTLEPQE